jgi:hypothetical protein
MLLLPLLLLLLLSRRRICARYLARPEEMRSVYHISVGKFEKKRKAGRFRLKGEYIIKIGLYEVGCHHCT